MSISFFLNKFKEHSDQPAIVWQDTTLNYSELLERFGSAELFIKKNKILPGEVIALAGDFTPNTIALLLALINNQNIIVPLNYPLKEPEFVRMNIAGIEKSIIVDIATDEFVFGKKSTDVTFEYYNELRKRKTAGLILFTSGTSGEPKGAVHNFSKLLNKFKTSRASLRTANFLLFDHWGGLNTLFHTLSNAGTVLALKNRNPESICEFVEKYKIELLPVSPSFLNLLLLSEAYKRHDLSSLKLITYGTEPMPETTLKRAQHIFANARFQQTYGLIELGVLRSKSREDGSLWIKLGGDGFELKVVDGILLIKAHSAMLGYLNAPAPFTEDGFFITGDQVETDGEYYKILGRRSELINVGGDKVYPQEVENVIAEMENVMEVTVYGEKHVMLGNIVCAKVKLKKDEDPKEFSRKLKLHCKNKMQNFKVPVKIFIVSEIMVSERFKKQRNF